MTRFALIGPTYPYRGGIAHYTTLLAQHLRKAQALLLVSFSRQYPGWLFPGKTVRIDAPCLDCGQSIGVEMRDGEVLTTEPEELVGYVAVPFSKWREDIPYA